MPISSVSLRRPTAASSKKSPTTKEPTALETNIRRKKARRNGRLRLSIRLTLICVVSTGFVLRTLIVAVLQMVLPNVKIGSLLFWMNDEKYSAVERAKYYGLPQRKMNSGHSDPSFWNKLGNATCDDQGSPALLESPEIQRLQLPQAILIGVQKGGTTALFHYLDQHPSVERTKKELYFLDEDMDKLVARTRTIPRKVARNLYHQKMRDGIVEARALEKQKNRHRDQLRLKLKDRELLAENPSDQQLLRRRLEQTANLPTIRAKGTKRNNRDIDDGFSRSHHGPPLKTHDDKPIQSSTKYVMDLTPNYMFHSDRVPFRIKCLVPWVRLLVLLRDPVARARSQYRMKLQMVLPKQHNSFGNPLPSLDEYIQNDLDALYEIGVLQNWTQVDFETFWKSPECWKAWHTYVHQGLNAPVGMGLYALQLKPFLDILTDIHHEALGQVRSEYFLAIDSQDLQLETDKTYQEVLNFLELPPLSLTEYAKVNKASESSKENAQRLSAAVQKRMEDAIAPYNRKLGDLLGKKWKDKWVPSTS